MALLPSTFIKKIKKIVGNENILLKKYFHCRFLQQNKKIIKIDFCRKM